MKRNKKIKTEYENSIKKEWNEDIHIGIIVLLLIGILIALIILFINRTDSMKSNVTSTQSNSITENIMREDNQQLINSKEDIDVEYLISSLNKLIIVDTMETTNTDEEATTNKVERKVSIDLNSEEVVDIVTTNEISGESLSITRFQFVNTMYKLLSIENKLPLIEGYQIDYEDSEEIPLNFIAATVYASYMKIIDVDKKFDGYKYITKVEADKAIQKLKAYLINYNDKVEDAPVIEGTLTAEEKSLLEEEAKGILAKRKAEDKLFGQSVATFKEPKTLAQIEVNKSNIEEIDINSLCTPELYVTDKKISMDYINIDEGLIDYNKLSASIDRKISGVTYIKPLNWEITESDSELAVYNSSIMGNDRGPFSFYQKIVGIKDNKVVAVFKHRVGLGGSVIYIDKNIDVDSVGIVLLKQYFENSDSKGEISMDEQDYILAISRLR